MAFDIEIHGIDMEVETESVRNELKSIIDDDNGEFVKLLHTFGFFQFVGQRSIEFVPCFR